MSRIEDMKDMIRKEIQSISNLEERVIFKKLMEGVFLTLYETNERMYKELEQRVMDDLAYDINRYFIQTGLVEKEYYDKSHHLMSSMCGNDFNETPYLVSDIRNEIEKNGRFPAAAVFMQCDFMEIKELYQAGEVFTGILTAGAEYKVSVKLEQNMHYLNELEHLYHLFMKNGIPWKTINAPYLFKMADVCITRLPEEIDGKEKVTNLRTDFEKYNHFVHYDRIPIWNVDHLKLDSIGFPVACGDHKNYEHVISIRDYGNEHVYLVDEEAGIRNVRQSGDKLLVTGEISNVKRWDVYVIRNAPNRQIDRYTYPVMGNQRRDGFAERFVQKTGQKVKSKAELERFIRGFGLENYIEYQDCRLFHFEEGEDQLETYPMNFFMKDEIRDGGGRKLLILYFKAKGNEKWLLRDLISFITSEVQELYPEYQCGGKMV